MTYKRALQADQRRLATRLALSLALPQVSMAPVWYRLLRSFPYLGAQRQAGYPVPGTESPATAGSAMTWSGPRAWLAQRGSTVRDSLSVNRPTRTDSKPGVSSGEKIDSKGHAAKGSAPMSPRASEKQRIEKTLPPALHGLLGTRAAQANAGSLNVDEKHLPAARRAQFDASREGSIVQRMAFVLASRQAPEASSSHNAAADRPAREASVSTSATPLRLNSDIASNAKENKTPMPCAMPMTTLAQCLPVLVRASGDWLGGRSARSTPRPAVEPGVGAASGNHSDEIPTQDVDLQSPGMAITRLNALLPSLALRAHGAAQKHTASSIDPAIKRANRLPAQDAVAYRLGAFFSQPGLSAISSTDAQAQPLAQALTAMHSNAPVQVLSDMVAKIEGRVEKKVERLLEKKFEQRPAPSMQDQNQNPSAESAQVNTALVSDEMVEILMRKMQALGQEARFRSGRLR